MIAGEADVPFDPLPGSLRIPPVPGVLEGAAEIHDLAAVGSREKSQRPWQARIGIGSYRHLVRRPEAAQGHGTRGQGTALQRR